jgi:hypothetical protein
MISETSIIMVTTTIVAYVYITALIPQAGKIPKKIKFVYSSRQNC